MFNPEWVAPGSGWLDPERWADLADRFLFHDCPEDTRRWARGTVHPMRIEGLLDEPCPMSSLINWPSICLIGSLDRTINPAWQEKVWRERTGKAVIKLEAGHCPHVSQPAKTADAILSALGRAA
jgi:pimeloyl-ACP methyl ester carboxylesterase